MKRFQPSHGAMRALTLSLAMGLSLPLTLPLTAHAEESAGAQQYNIPAGPLNTVLTQFSSASGVLIAGDLQLAAGRQSPGLQGSYDAEEGLTRILSGTGLSATRQPDGSFALSGADSNASNTLDPVTVSVSQRSAQDTLDYDFTDITRLQPQDSKDLFKNEASVSVGGSIPVNEKIYVRGVEETAMLVTVDGARQNNKVFHHNATTLIDPSLFKSVSASAGVAAADDGPGALGGALKFETVDVADLLAPGDDLGGFLHGRYASNGDALTTAGSLFGRSNGFEALGYVKKVDGDNYEDGNGDEVNFTEPALLSGLAKLAYENDDMGRIELSHEQVNDDSQRPYRANFSGLTAGRPVPDSRNYDLTRKNSVLGYSRLTGSGLWNPEVTVANNETELKTTENPLAAPTTTVVYTGITESTSATAKNTFHTGFVDITAGLDYYDDSAVFKYAGDPDLEESAENTGAFVQFRQTLFQRLDLSYGLRYDQQDFIGTDESSHEDEGASSNVFAEFHFNEHFAINGGYADVWGGTALAENFILNGAWVYGDMMPVKAHNHTVGFKANWNGFFASANQFETGIRDARVPTWGGGPDLYSDFDIDGFDATVGYRASLGRFAVTYADIESEKDDEVASSYDGNYFTVPLGEQIALNGELYWPNSQWALGLNAEIALENDALEAEGLGEKQESYTVVDVYVDYSPIDALSLRLSVDNINDEEYTDRASYGQEFPTVETLLEPGRSINMDVRYNF
ncbi:TonB-dependent receptor [Alcanivorax sp.]|uniref:TonB-dependent receptor n=1 Tax=Alcanivorax sp. TaxID=1872427 RepID=UPI0025C431DE|nr:TonB-dependent receptor [Alcanivorax sp.]